MSPWIIPASGAETAAGLDTGQPGLWVLYPPINASGGLTANRAYMTRFMCPRAMTITKIAFCLTTAATADDPCDVGIYSPTNPLTRLVSAGSQSGLLNSALGVKQVTITPISLTAGQVYYAAFAVGAIGGTSAQIVMNAMNSSFMAAFGSVPPNLEQTFNNTSFPLPASLASGGGITSAPAYALLQ
jgi:hypothetical protein